MGVEPVLLSGVRWNAHAKLGSRPKGIECKYILGIMHHPAELELNPTVDIEND